MITLRRKSARRLGALGLAVAVAVGLVGCTGDADDPSPSGTAEPSASASTQASGSPAELDTLSDPDGPSFAELADADRSLDRFAAGDILVDSWDSGPAAFTATPTAEASRLRLMIFCDDAAEYRVAVWRGDVEEDATWGDSCMGGGVTAYLTAPIEGPAADLDVEVTVPDGVGYRVVVVEAEPGAQA